jgi:hypothetical protein
LKSIEIPSSVVVLGKWSFYECKSLESVTFESGSRLERIEESAFSWSGLKSIEIPSSVILLGKESFSWWTSVKSVSGPPRDSELDAKPNPTFRRDTPTDNHLGRSMDLDEAEVFIPCGGFG